MFDWDNDIYNYPVYPVREAAQYLHIPPGTLHSWLHGWTYRAEEGKRRSAPLIQRPSPRSLQISFINLVEASILRSIRKAHGVPLYKVRHALDYLDQRLGIPHPLARFEFKTDGIDLFVEGLANQELVTVSQRGQLAIKDILENYLTRVEWNEQKMATRLFLEFSASPRYEKSISIDPRISFGRPVLAGTRITTRAIAERFEAGEPVYSIADDYGLGEPQVDEALRFELGQLQVA